MALDFDLHSKGLRPVKGIPTVMGDIAADCAAHITQPRHRHTVKPVYTAENGVHIILIKKQKINLIGKRGI